MIDNIRIQNYRCYEDTFIEGFKKVNLIGGLNNAGKTILLEAILLNISPTSQNINLLKRLRGEDINSNDLPEYAWDNFFFNQNKEKEITITAGINNKEIQLSVSSDNAANIITKDIEENDEEEDLQILLNDFASNDKILKSVLHLKHKIDDKTAVDVLTFIAHTKGYTVKELNIPISIEANFIPASSKRTPAVLARDYGIAEKRNKENLVLKALQIVDINIEAIKVSVVGGAHLEVRRGGEKFMSVSLFGDAINKILNIILSLVNNEGSILLIDEIENGIHYTVQRDFWKFIFELTVSESFNNQVFATTHSLEMIKAFADVASKEYKESSAYFELFHREATNRIDYNLHDLETFQYELSNNLPIRGE